MWNSLGVGDKSYDTQHIDHAFTVYTCKSMMSPKRHMNDVMFGRE